MQEFTGQRAEFLIIVIFEDSSGKRIEMQVLLQSEAGIERFKIDPIEGVSDQYADEFDEEAIVISDFKK